MVNLSTISMLRRVFVGCIWLLMLMGLVACGRKTTEEQLMPIVEKALNDTSSVYYVNPDDFSQDLSSFSIGIFDDGLWGFNVLEAFLTADQFDNITGAAKADGIADFAGEQFVYLADGANASYGQYPQRGNLDFLKESVVRDALFLLDNSYYNLVIDERPYGVKSRSKLLVCANAAASTHGFQEVETLLDRLHTDVMALSVADAAATSFLDWTTQHSDVAVGVLASPQVIEAGYYEKAIRRSKDARAYSGKVAVCNQATPHLESMMGPVAGVSDSTSLPQLGFGEGMIDITLLDRYDFDFANGAMIYSLKNGFYSELTINSPENLARFYLVSLVEKYRKQGNEQPLQAVILACPYMTALRPILEETLASLREYKRNGIYLYEDVIAKDFVFIDPAQEVVRSAYQALRESHLLALRVIPTEVEVYLSMPTYGTDATVLTANGMFKEAYRYGRAAGSVVVTTKPVPMAYRYLSLSDLEQMQWIAPTAYKLIVNRLY